MRLERPSFRRGALLLSLAAALHGALYIPLVSVNEKTDTWPYVASANALLDATYTTPLRTGFYFVYGRGWFDITGARIDRVAWNAPERQAFRPPGYPAYLALFGKRDVYGGDHTAALIGQAALTGVGALLLMLTVRRWWGEGVALLAGVIYAIDPWSKHYVPLVLSETVAGFVALAGLYAFTRAWESRRWSWWAAAAALAAALALVRAVFVVAAPLVLAGALVQQGALRQRLVRAGVATVAAALLLVPWLAWTTAVAGRPTMANWGEGYNLLLAAAGEGHGRPAEIVDASPAVQRRLEHVRRLLPTEQELLRDPESHTRYLAAADVELRDDALALYRERIVHEPARVAWELGYRSWFLWTAHKDWFQPSGLPLLALRALDWVVLLLASAGAALAIARGGAGRGAVVLLATYTVVLATHHVEARFAMPLRGVLLALVALSLSVAWAARRGSLRRADE